MASDLLIELDVDNAVTINGDWFEERDALLRQSVDITEVTDDTVDATNDIFNDLHQTGKSLEKMREKIKKPFLEAGRKIDNAAKMARKDLVTEKERLSKLLAKHRVAKQREAAAERARKEQEMQDKIQAEMAEAEAAKELGFDAPTQVYRDDEIDFKNLDIAERKADPKSTKSKGTWKLEFDVPDHDKLARFFLVLKKAKVNDYLREHKKELMESATEEPRLIENLGIRVWKVFKVSAR